MIKLFDKFKNMKKRWTIHWIGVVCFIVIAILEYYLLSLNE